ncbi:terminal uridylyltransferase 4-like isoform X2 [Periplaneta americana]|uniref:terminal uridylyltransferase 4-like isoform X2 n=1 Tax=Periplaneta americana TaxID=6978 RepID=UPI0037E8CAED
MAETSSNGAQPKIKQTNITKEKKKQQQNENHLQADAQKDDPLTNVRWDILMTDKKKRKRRSKKKKTADAGNVLTGGFQTGNAQTGNAQTGNVQTVSPPEGAAATQNQKPSPRAKVEEPLPPPVLDSRKKKILEQNQIVVLSKKSAKNPKAVFLCKLCKYHCDNLTVVDNHIADKRHCKALEGEADRQTLINLPQPTHGMLASISNLLKEEFNKYGLSKEELVLRQEIATSVGTLISDKKPGFQVRLYGSSASGFGLKSSDVNLELCVPPEESAPKGLHAASEIIEKHDAYSDVKCEFNADIPAVRFIDRSTNMPCSLTLSNNHSYKIAVLFSKYASVNENVRMLGTIFRLWAKYCKLDCPDSGMWPPYAFPFLVIYFLQQLKEPVLPVLHELKKEAASSTENGADSYIDPKDLLGVWSSKNTMSLGELWLELLRFYSLDFDVLNRVVCIEQSAPLMRSENMKRWLGKKMAIKDPFLPKRNVSRSMTSQVSFEYCMGCFRNTYKYFGVIQTETGPIFSTIVKFYTDGGVDTFRAIYDKFDTLVRNTIQDHPYFSKDDAAVMTVSELEDKLRRTAQRIHEKQLSMLSVTPERAQDMFNRFNSTYLEYEFKVDNFIGDQKYPEYCTSCQKEGHTKENCKDNVLPPFNPALPPMTDLMRDDLNTICKETYETCSTSPEEEKIRKDIIQDIENYITSFYPTAKLELFGSSCNGFGLTKSDIDICLTFTDSETGKEHDFVKLIEDLLEKLKKFGPLNNLVPITTAKVPILKFHHMASDLEGDISIYNTLGQQNTRLLKTYSEIDTRVKMLGYMMKKFAKECDMCDASRGSLSSYAYIIMVIYFLQQCSPPVLPVLQELTEAETKPQRIVEDCDTYFFEDISKLTRLWPDYGTNTTPVGELWIQLLKFYSGEFDFSTFVISIKQKERLLRFEKLWTSKWMAIEDPFDLSHNLGAGLSPKMHVFIIRSFRNGYAHFGSPVPEGARSKVTLEQYFFNSASLTSGDPPNDRGCRICKKIGHICKDCPQRRQVRNRKAGNRAGGGRGEATGAAAGGAVGKHVESPPTVQNQGLLRNKNPGNSPLRGFNPPFSPLRGVQASRGKFRNPGESLPFRGNFTPVHGNFRSQEKAGMRYGMPRASPPFKTCASHMDTSRKNGAMCVPPFGNVTGVSRRELLNLPVDAGPRLETTPVDKDHQYVKGYYEMTRQLGLLRERNNSGRQFNHLKPKGETNFHVPQVKNDGVMVMDVRAERR